MHLGMRQPHGDAIERQGLALRIKAQRHRRAGAETCQQKIIGARAAIEPAGARRLVRQQLMPADTDLLLEAAAPCFAHDHIRVRGLRLWLGQIEIALSPGGNDLGHVARIARAAEKMIGVRQRHEALGMFRSLEDAAGILDADPIVGRRVEDQQRLMQARDLLTQILLGDISRNARRIRNRRPSSETSTSPCCAMSASRSRNRPVTCAGSLGAAIVTTARASGTSAAAARTAAPPRLWPIRIAGARLASRKAPAAATRSATLDENVVLANSPSLEPSPVKSKRNTPMPSAVSACAMRRAACTSLPQVKQCANSA